LLEERLDDAAVVARALAGQGSWSTAGRQHEIGSNEGSERVTSVRCRYGEGARTTLAMSSGFDHPVHSGNSAEREDGIA
ncbi:MAG: hypothetical protein ACOCQY_04865, partial [Halorhabdus sp.]